MNYLTETDNEPDERTGLLSPKNRQDNQANNVNSLSYQYQQQIYLSQVLQTALNDQRSTFRQNASFIITLLVYTLERFAFYGLICNYILYLNKQPLDWKSFNASLILLIFFGILNITSVIGGWVADSFLGKYTTICLSFFGYIIGYAVFPYLSFQNRIPDVCTINNSILNWTFEEENFPFYGKPDRSLLEETCSWIIILSVVLIGISVGFIRANLGPFGADQVKKVINLILELDFLFNFFLNYYIQKFLKIFFKYWLFNILFILRKYNLK